jgi:hypothetical protein
MRLRRGNEGHPAARLLRRQITEALASGQRVAAADLASYLRVEDQPIPEAIRVHCAELLELLTETKKRGAPLKRRTLAEVSGDPIAHYYSLELEERRDRREKGAAGNAVEATATEFHCTPSKVRRLITARNKKRKRR